MASAGVLGESLPDGIRANTAASAVCITSGLPVTRPQPDKSTERDLWTARQNRGKCR